MAGEKTQAEVDAQILAGIRVNGNKEITPPIHAAIDYAITNSYVNKKDGGLVLQSLLGYTTDLTPSNDKHLTPKKYVDDLIGAIDYWDITGNTLASRGTFGSISGAFGWGYKINNIDVGGWSNEYEPYFGASSEFDNTYFSIQEKEVSVVEGVYGTIYNDNSWANTADFEDNGLTSGMNGDKITLTGGAGTFDKSFDLLGSSLLEKWRIVAQLKITTTGFGFGIGMRSSNAAQEYNMVGRIDTSSGDSYLNGPDGTQNAASGSSLSLSVNDVIELDLERNVDVLTLKVRNVTTASAIITTTYTYLLSSSYLHNTGRFSIFGFGGNCELHSFFVESDEVTNANLMVIGDSKTQGYFATNFAGRFASQLDADFPTTVISAGGYDRTVEVLLRIDEIIALAPRKVILCIGSNDPRSGRSSGDFQTDYEDISDQLIAAGIDVYYCLPFPEDGQDLTGQKTWIEATFDASKIIDTWTPMLDGAYGLKTVYDNGDGIHPNQAGNDIIYETIKTSQFIKSILRIKNIAGDTILNMLKTGTLLLSDGLGFSGKKQIYERSGTLESITSSGSLKTIHGDYQSKSATYTALVTDEIIEATANTFTITLYTAVGNKGRLITINNQGAGVVTVEGDGTETINGSLNQTLNQYDSLTVVSNGTNWIVI